MNNNQMKYSVRYTACHASGAHSRHGNVAAVDDDVPQLLTSRLVGQFQGVGRLQ